MMDTCKRLGKLAMAVVGGFAICSVGSGLMGGPSTAFAARIGPINDLLPGAYLATYFDVSASFTKSQQGYGGPGHSGGNGDGLVRVVDVGNYEANTATGDLCINFYVFDDDQEMQECCSCPTTADEVNIFTTINELTSNPQFSSPLGVGVIKIVGSNDAFGCINGSATGGTLATAGSIQPTWLAEGLEAWINHTESIASNNPGFKPPFGFVTTNSVEKCEHAPIDLAELTILTNECSNIELRASGRGICSCKPPPPPPPPTITVSVAYANNFDSDPDFFPSNSPGWKGSAGVTPGVNYFGFAGAGEFDGGGILIQNTSAVGSVVINGVTVDLNQPSPPVNCTLGTGTTVANCPNIVSTALNPTNPWAVGVFPYTIGPGEFLMLGQSNPGLGFGAVGCAPGAPLCSNFDTSDLPPLGIQLPPSCMHDGVIPKVHVNVTIAPSPATTLTFTDTTQVLNTGGVDGADCNVPPGRTLGFEGSDWVEIH